ncbi:MAG: hypothetical protein JNL93_20630 [Pelomonas sp.]|nr:hypothetical protein [Roseateles sp.]
MKRTLILAATSFVLMTSVAPAKEGDHQHDAKVFASVAAGLSALEAAIADAKAKVAAGNFKALHETSEDLHSIVGGLKTRAGDVAAEAKERYSFNVDQVRNLHEQLEAAHESASKADAERVIKRLEDVTTRLKALTLPKQ